MAVKGLGCIAGLQTGVDRSSRSWLSSRKYGVVFFSVTHGENEEV